MRSPSRREGRLLLTIAVAAFLILNFLGYQQLAQRRARAVAQQRAFKLDLARLKELQAAKPAVDVNTQWLETRLPAYKDIDQFETYLYNIVLNRAAAAGDIELTKKDPRPTQKDSTVHRSIMEIECTTDMESLVKFLHSLQDREAFRFISFLELAPTKDEERIRCQARIEQWWRPDSAELNGLPSSDAPMLPDLPAPETSAASVEQGAPEAVKTAASQNPPPESPPVQTKAPN